MEVHVPVAPRHKLPEPDSNEYNRHCEIISAQSKELGEWEKQHLDTEEIGTLDDLLEWIKNKLLVMEMVAQGGGNDPIAKRGESIRAQILDKIHDLRLANMGKGIVGLPPSPDLPEDPQLALRVARDWVLTAKNATSFRTQDQRPQQAHEHAEEDSKLDEDDISILRYLAKENICKDQQDIAAGTERSRRTIGPRLQVLRELGLTHRPKGNRGGDAITQEGRGLLERLDQPSA